MLMEKLKKFAEGVTGLEKPSLHELKAALHKRKAHAFYFKRDGFVPNNPQLPLIIYRSPIGPIKGVNEAAIFEELFAAHGWRSSWRNGVYDYLHYHATTHEVLGIAKGAVRVRFGGTYGKAIDLNQGDVVILPAGTGHKRLRATKDLLVVGAYPQGKDYDECLPNGPARKEEFEKALALIAKVPKPKCDPVYGSRGPLMKLWKGAK